MAACANCSRALQPEWKFCISCGARTSVPATGVVQIATPMAIRPPADSAAAGRRINVLAVLALALGCLLSPLAALFGHMALAQIKVSGERGFVISWIAVVLGYVWLTGLVIVVVGYLTTNA